MKIHVFIYQNIRYYVQIEKKKCPNFAHCGVAVSEQ